MVGEEDVPGAFPSLTMSGNPIRHLAFAGQDREKLAVERLLTMAPAIHKRWLESLGIDPLSHWCVIWVELTNLPVRSPVEIDVIFGNLVSQSWPPSRLDFLAAVEAKAWLRKWEDTEEFGPGAKTNLWEQVKRNRECGFDRIAGIDIVCTPPGQTYRNALKASDELGSKEVQRLLKEAEKAGSRASAGYAAFAFGAVAHKDEGASGSIPMLACRDAPTLGAHTKALDAAVQTILQYCPQPPAKPYHFARRGAGWASLPSFT